MKLHLVGGFLGSGKTTATLNAAKALKVRGISCALITNDPDVLFDDTLTYHAPYHPAEEVINHCFSSDFELLSDKIASMQQFMQAQYCFAECVGTCTDVEATVVKPLRILQGELFDQITYSVLADARLLLSFLKGEPFPFCDELLYLFSRQLDEADLLVISRIDLLDPLEFPLLKRLTDLYFKDRLIITLDASQPQNIEHWLDTLENLSPVKKSPFEVDYRVYSRAESAISWLDEEISFTSVLPDAAEIASGFMERMVTEIRKAGIPVGHLRFKLNDDQQTHRFEWTPYLEKSIRQTNSFNSTHRSQLIIVARLEASKERIHALIRSLLAETNRQGLTIRAKYVSLDAPQGSFSYPPLQKANHGCAECICLKNLFARNEARRKEGSAEALAQLESEQFECCGVCSDVDGCCC